jgi:hypothetical protein
MIKVFANIIVDTAIFLEFTGDELLNEDVSIQASEQLAAELQNLTLEEKRLLTLEFKNIGSSLKDKQKSDFVANLSEYFGL